MAIESTNFFSFLKATRAPIGLSDQFNLSEIFESDQRKALINLLLNPEGLDQIYGLSTQGIQQEDIRLIGGLDKPVINSLGLFDSQDSQVSFDLSTKVKIGDPVGEPGKQSFASSIYSDNIIVLHGGIAAKNVEYDFIDRDGQIRTTNISVSRQSLLNSQTDPATSKYTEASYPGLLRVRRRSHINTLKLDKKLFVEKSFITESPSALIKIPTYMRTGNVIAPPVTLLESFATKNSPFIVPIKVTGTGSFELGPGSLIANDYYFGYEIKRKSDLQSVVAEVFNNSRNSSTVSQSFNLNGTIGNGVECLLYIYCSPSLIEILKLNGLGIKEDEGRDLGLVGFNNLRELELASNEFTTLPTWLKVNYLTLQKLSFQGNGFWNQGIISYFDYQDFSSSGIVGSVNQSVPAITATQVLSYSGYRSSTNTTDQTDGLGKVSSYEGTFDTVTDSEDSGTKPSRLYKFSREDSITGAPDPCVVNEDNGFRVFSALTDLNLGISFKHHNTDFSVLLPSLRNLVMERPAAESPNQAFGLLPKMKNTLELMSYNIKFQINLGGSIKYVGNTLQYNSADLEDVRNEFIGQFKFKSWNCDRNVNTDISIIITGGICANDGMLGGKIVPTAVQDGANKYSHVNGSDSVAIAWSGWLDNLESINIRRSAIALNVAEGSTLNWKKLKNINVQYCGTRGKTPGAEYFKVNYNSGLAANATDSVDILQAPVLTSIEGFDSGWGGRIFSIQGAKNLDTLFLGEGFWEGYENGKYILPRNFSIVSDVPGDQNKLRRIAFNGIRNQVSKNRTSEANLQFREDDFKYLSNLQYFKTDYGYFSGVLPSFPNESVTNKVLDIYIAGSRFYDLSSIGTDKNNRVRNLRAYNQGIGIGGAMLPNFKISGTNNRLTIVEFNNSLSTKYGSTWNADTSKRSKYVFNMLNGVENAPAGVTEEITSVPGTFTSRDEPGGIQAVSNLLEVDAGGENYITNYIRVGDRVISSGVDVGFVKQTRNISGATRPYIYVSTSLNLTGATLSFKRAGQTISDYFENAAALQTLDLRNCSLVGTIPTFIGNNGKIKTVNLFENLLTTYQPGTLQNLTAAGILPSSNKPNLTTFNLSYNALSKQSIRNIISDLYEVATYFGNNLNTINVDLRATKADLTSGSLINWKETEIFDQGTAEVPGTPDSPGIPASPDPLLTKYNQLGSTFPRIRLFIFN
jgi:hypothetical protein